MMQNCGDTQKLFAKSVPVTVKDGFTNQCRKCTLFLTVEWKEASAAVNKQELLVSLTDNNDPFFLYHLHLSEEDFQVLKSNQGLLVDFTAFPQKFIDLLEISLAEEDKASPKFLLIFNTSEKVGSISPTSQLDVVETNPFKHLIHLTLKFSAATDSSVKQYLAMTLKNYKEENQQQKSRISFLEQDTRTRLSSLQASLEQKSQELEKLRSELGVQMSLKETAHARQLQDERERFLNKQREIEMRCESEKKEKEYNYNKDIQQLEKRVSTLDALNKELNDQNRKRDHNIQELKSYMSSLEEEKRRCKNSLQECKEKNQELQSELKQKLSELSQQGIRIEELVQNSNYLKQMMKKLQEQFEKSRENEKKIEFEYSELNKEFQESKRVIKRQQVDIDKGNEVISKLQRQIQSSHAEQKEMQSNITKLHKSLSNRDKTIRLLQEEVKNCNQIVDQRNDEIEQLSNSIATLHETISKLEKEMKARDEVIKYLNRQLSEKCILPKQVPPSYQEQSLPINEKRYSAGDADVIATTATVTEKPKTLSSRNGLQHNANSLHNHIPFDSAYSSSSSYNAKNTSKNPDMGNFELDSAALSAAFGTGDLLKHSTAKKFVNSRTGNAIRGRVKK